MHPNLKQTLSIVFSVLLVGWGLFTLATFFGTLNHIQFLLPLVQNSAGQVTFHPVYTTAVESCGGQSAYACIGMRVAGVVLKTAIERFSPIGWYIALSAILFVVLLGIMGYRNGDVTIRLRIAPVSIVLFFIISLWFLFTTLSYGGSQQPLRLLINPRETTQNTTTSSSAQAALQRDYDALKARGCLDVGNLPNGVEAGLLKTRCIQASFFSRVLSPLLFLLAFLLTVLSLGRRALRFARTSFDIPWHEAIFSGGIGIAILIAVLWLFALCGFYTPIPIGLALLALLALSWRDLLVWLRRCVLHSEVEFPIYEPTPILAWMIVSLLALNYLTVIRPFPIGWDDLGVYLNQPRLLVSYGHIIPKLSLFAWEYITSLGFLFFGQSSAVGATVAMLLNWLTGPLAMIVIYVTARTYSSRSTALLASLLYGSLPLVGHFSFADMKVDNAVFTFGALAIFAVLLALLPSGESPPPHERRRSLLTLLALGGIFAGISFGFKATSVMIIFALLGGIFGFFTTPLAALGTLLLSFILFIYQGALSIPRLSERLYGNPLVLSRTAVLMTLTFAGAICIALALWKRSQHLTVLLQSIGVFLAGCIVTVLPWLTVNNVQYGRIGLFLSGPNTLAPNFVLSKTDSPSDIAKTIRTLPGELMIDRSHPACAGGTSTKEELDRYWGYEGGWMHYLTLPWREIMNLDSFGYYVTMVPIFLVLPILLLAPLFWSAKQRWARFLAIVTGLLTVEWAFLGNGIPWYGIGMFLGLCIGSALLIAMSPQKWARAIAILLVTGSLISSFSYRLSQFELQASLRAYAIGAISAEALEAKIITHYSDIRDDILKRSSSDRPYAYRMGTFIPYFIPRNIELLPVSDNQLDLFSCLNQEEDHAKTLKRLQALGFSSMIFDTNTDTIEKEQGGTLHQKVRRYKEFINDPTLGIQKIVEDTTAGIAYYLLP